MCLFGLGPDEISMTGSPEGIRSGDLASSDGIQATSLKAVEALAGCGASLNEILQKFWKPGNLAVQYPSELRIAAGQACYVSIRWCAIENIGSRFDKKRHVLETD